MKKNPILITNESLQDKSLLVNDVITPCIIVICHQTFWVFSISLRSSITSLRSVKLKINFDLL